MGVETFEARVKRGKVVDGDGDDDKGKAVVLFLGRGFSVGDVEGGWGLVTFGVEEFLSREGDGGVAGLDNGAADAITEGGAFGVDGMEIDGQVRRKGVKDSARRGGLNVGKDGSGGGAEGNFFEDRVRVDGGKGWKRNGWGGGAVTEGNRHGGGVSGCGDGSVRELDHGEVGAGEQLEGKKRMWVV